MLKSEYADEVKKSDRIDEEARGLVPNIFFVDFSISQENMTNAANETGCNHGRKPDQSNRKRTS
jgi:hypothetical protein